MLSSLSAVSGYLLPGAAPSSTIQRSTTVRCLTLDDVKADSGVTPLPVPGGFFDPAGLMSSQGQIDASYRHFKEVEIKHGRIAMLAAVGFVVGEQFHPLFGGAIDGPSYLAFQQTPLQTFWPAVVLAIGAFETLTSIPAFEEPQRARMQKGQHRPPAPESDPCCLPASLARKRAAPSAPAYCTWLYLSCI